MVAAIVEGDLAPFFFVGTSISWLVLTA